MAQRQRAVGPSRRPPAPKSPNRYGRMLFYAGLLGGISALLLGFVLLLSVVGVYVILVWPLTFWDLANLGLEKLGSWTWVIVAATFSGGAFGGCCYFSGLLFRFKPEEKIPARRPVRMAH